MGRGKLTENKAEKDEVLTTQELATWTENRGPIAFQIGLSTFGILALELALIRWTSGQIRVFAYFKNLVLISSFLGMGLGVALGRKHRKLVHYTHKVFTSCTCRFLIRHFISGELRLSLERPSNTSQTYWFSCYFFLS
jgi:hypothetical protein